MNDNYTTIRYEAPTRRDYVKYGGTVIGGGLLAGCTGGQEGDGTPESTGTDSREESTEDNESYEVCMEPVGCVEFDSIPDRWVSYFSTYGDMGIALGQADGLVGLFIRNNYPTQFYDELGLEVDIESIPQMNADSVDKEIFYELGADVHLIDPNMLVAWFGWEESDIEEIEENVGPFFGNMIRRHGDEWHDYGYPTLYEAFGNIADVFQERERYEAFSEIHDDVLADIQSRLPPAEDRPEIGLLSVNSEFEEGSFWAYPIGDSAGKKQYRDLKITDAFGSFDRGGAFQIDYEELADVDPDILVFHFGLSHTTESEFQERMDVMRDDPVGNQLTAVANDRLVRGGTPYQGPVINLFQTEIAAKQFYPDEFGDLDGDAELFDRQRVADIINGEF
jgi:iron complex transport system substrate-binding protein